MSPGDLAGALAWALAAGLIVRAPVRPRVLGRISFVLSIILNEWPALPLAYLIAVAVVSWPVAGDVGGWALLVVVGAAIGGFAWMIVQGQRAPRRLIEALDRGLGAGWADGPDQAARARFGRFVGTGGGPGLARRARLCLLPLWWPDPRVRRSVAAYGPDPRQRMDVLERVGGPGPGPAVALVYLHGGAYSGGRRRWEAQWLQEQFARRGWLVISADYRLRPRHGMAEHLADAKRVIASAHRRLGEEGRGPARVFVAGSSAGAHLAAICAQTADDPALQPGFEHEPTGIAGAICLYGYYGDYYGMSGGGPVPSSPLRCAAGPATAPVLVVHGDHDSLTPVSGARALVGHLRSGGATAAYAELPGANHAFDMLRSVRFDAVVAAADAFTASVLGGRPKR